MPALRPPKTLEDFADPTSSGAEFAQTHSVAEYVREYNNGWSVSNSGRDSAKWESGYSSDAWDDGYLDAAAGRPKWHLPNCPEHTNYPTGCQEA